MFPHGTIAMRCSCARPLDQRAASPWRTAQGRAPRRPTGTGQTGKRRGTRRRAHQGAVGVDVRARGRPGATKRRRRHAHGQRWPAAKNEGRVAPRAYPARIFREEEGGGGGFPFPRSSRLEEGYGGEAASSSEGVAPAVLRFSKIQSKSPEEKRGRIGGEEEGEETGGVGGEEREEG